MIWTSGLICRSQFVFYKHALLWMGSHRKESLSIHIVAKLQNPSIGVVDQKSKISPKHARCLWICRFYMRLVRLIAAALAAAALLAGGVSVVVEIGDDDRIGRARSRDAVAHRHQNDLHATVERSVVRLPQDRRQRVVRHRLLHQTAQLFRSVVEPAIPTHTIIRRFYFWCNSSSAKE